MGFWIFGDDDDTVNDAKNEVWGEAKQYVSDQAAKLQSDYDAKYNAATAHFNELQSQIDAKEKDLNAYAGTVNTTAAATTDVIQKFNQGAKEASIAVNNNGTHQTYADPTAKVPEQSSISPGVILAVAVGGYFMFFRKRR